MRHRRVAREARCWSYCGPTWRLYPVGVFLGSVFSIHELPLGIDYNVMSVLHHDVVKEARAGIEPANSGFAERRPVAHRVRA
jgi:hypothetical protein